MKRLIMIGACYLDTILSVPHLPEEDSKLRATSLRVRRGGNCPNSLEVLQQLLALSPTTGGGGSITTHLVAVLPDAGAPATARIRASLGGGGGGGGGGGARPPVDLSRCVYRGGQAEPASCFVLRSEATGSRTIVNYNGLADMTLGEFVRVEESFRGRGAQGGEGDAGDECWWHFEGRVPETTLLCIRHLRATRPRDKISVEVENPLREGLRGLAAEADVVFYSRSWAESQGYVTAEDCLRREAPPRASIAFCTWGAQGASAILLPGRECLHCPARGEMTAGAEFRLVDSVGAGDTFIAGALYGLVCHGDDWDAQSQLRLAVDLATAKVQMEGFEGLAARLPLADAP